MDRWITRRTLSLCASRSRWTKNIWMEEIKNNKNGPFGMAPKPIQRNIRNCELNLIPGAAHFTSISLRPISVFVSSRHACDASRHSNDVRRHTDEALKLHFGGGHSHKLIRARNKINVKLSDAEGNQTFRTLQNRKHFRIYLIMIITTKISGLGIRSFDF